jgi:membrane protein DedA with SNARE-associated domain
MELMLQSFVEQFTYLGIFLVLLAGSLGLPIPEEMAIIAAGVMSHEGLITPWGGLVVCLLGVLSGDVVLYWTGRNGGERVLRWRVVRFVLTPAREQRLKEAYHRHAMKTIVTARHVMGLRAAAFLTAGIARVPFGKFLLADAATALVGVPFSFGLAYFFTDHIKAIYSNVHRAERWLGLLILIVVALAAFIIVRRRDRAVIAEVAEPKHRASRPRGPQATGHPRMAPRDRERPFLFRR